MYIEPNTCLNMHTYIKLTYKLLLMQYDILQYLSVHTIHIHALCYKHIDDVNRSLSYIMFNYLTRK